MSTISACGALRHGNLTLQWAKTTGAAEAALKHHSKDGAKNLAHYAAKAAEVGWAYTVH